MVPVVNRAAVVTRSGGDRSCNAIFGRSERDNRSSDGACCTCCTGRSLRSYAGGNLQGQIVVGFKKLDADFVCDTLWTADVIIIEEGTELFERLQKAREAGTPEPLPLKLTPVLGLQGVKEAELVTELFGKLRAAVVYGFKNVQHLLDIVRAGHSPWHFVEVMFCPGGCIGGSAKGSMQSQTLTERQQGLYLIGPKAKQHNSHNNPDVI